MGVSASRAGKLRGSLPNVNSTALSTTMPSATVAISQALEPRARERPHRDALDDEAVSRAQQQGRGEAPPAAASPSLTANA